MGNEVPIVPFADIVEIISGGTPKTNIAEYWGGEIPWLTVTDFNTGYRWVNSADKTITDLGVSNSATTILHQGDVIISARGTVGVIAQLARPMAFNQSCYGIRGKKGVSNTDFIYYALKNAVSQMLQVAYGGVFNTITRDTFKIIKTRLPHLKEQEAIACILGALDDKLELNRQMCKALEDTAQAIFKNWFIDFDPVHTKAAGMQPEGLKPEIAELFPDSFEDSDFGKIPKGWKVSTLDDVITRIPVGKKYEQKTANSKGQVPILDQGQSGIIGYHDNEPGVIASKDKPIIVFANHTCYMRLIYYPFSAIQNVLPFVGNGINTIWLYYATLGKQTFTEYKGHWPDLIRQHICAPNMRLDDRFSDIVTPILWKIWGCFEENDTLGSIRDSLLPRLISGELKVKDAEKIASRLV